MKKNVVIFGTGLIYQIIKDDVFEKYNVVALADNNRAKWNSVIDGVVVCNPEFLNQKTFDIIVISASHSIEICRQLVALGIPIEKMEVGANYVFDKMLPSNGDMISYSINDSYKLVCKAIRDDAELISVNIFKNKRMLLNTSSIPALIALFDHNNHLPHFFALSERYYGIQNGIFLDIGANVGTTSIEATEFCNVTKVISFEPSSDTYALLMANIFLNKLENRIAGYRYAVGEKRALNKLMFSPVGSGDNRLRKEDHGADFQQRYNDVGMSLSEDVETVAIDELLDEKLSSIKYVWIDVQGYEYFVLKGCEKLLNHNNISVQIEYWPHGLNETNSLDLLNNFLIERFSGYVDMNEYTENGAVVHDIGDIVFLAKSLLDVNSNFHTDLFLLK